MNRLFSRLSLAWFLCALCFGAAHLQAEAPPPRKAPPTKGTLVVTIHGLRSDQGNIAMLLFNDPKGYPGQPQLALFAKQTTPKNKKAVFLFEALPHGLYAIATYHDENGNNKLDTNWLGIPKEGTGASNDAKGFMGPPKFRDASFRFAHLRHEILIKMNY